MNRVLAVLPVLGAVALGAVAAPPSAPRRYPIPPRPLRMLVAEAEVVVVASVNAPAADAAPPRGHFPETDEPVAGTTIPNGVVPDVVTLAVEQVLKGDPATKRIDQTNYKMICPAPAQYVVGTKVLAFLDRSKRGNGFTTHALSYGAKTLKDDDLTLYVARVKEELAILSTKDETQRRVAQVEWLVKCAESAATRWEGAYELAASGDFMSDYDEPHGERDAFAKDLTKEQRDRLRDALLGAKEFDGGERCLEELFARERDPRLLQWLVARLRALPAKEQSESYGVASLLIERVARRDERLEVRRLAEAFKNAQEFSFRRDRDKAAAPTREKIVSDLLALYDRR